MRVRLLNNLGIAMKNVVIGAGFVGVAAVGVGIAVNFMEPADDPKTIRTPGSQVIYTSMMQQPGSGTYARQGTGLAGGDLSVSQRAAAESGEVLRATTDSGASGRAPAGGRGAAGSARSEVPQESETGPDTGAKKLVSGFGTGADFEAQQRMLETMNQDMLASAGGSGGGTQVQANALANAFGSNNPLGNVSGGGRSTAGGQTWNPGSAQGNIDAAMKNAPAGAIPDDISNMLKDAQKQMQGVQQRGRLVGMSDGVESSGGPAKKLGSQRVSDSTGQAYALRQAMASAKEAPGLSSTALSDIYQGGQNQSGSAPAAPASSNTNDNTPTWNDIKRGNYESGTKDTDKDWEEEQHKADIKKARTTQAWDLALGILCVGIVTCMVLALLVDRAKEMLSSPEPYSKAAAIALIAVYCAILAAFMVVSGFAIAKILKHHGDGADIATSTKALTVGIIGVTNLGVIATWLFSQGTPAWMQGMMQGFLGKAVFGAVFGAIGTTGFSRLAKGFKKK